MDAVSLGILRIKSQIAVRDTALREFLGVVNNIECLGVYGLNKSSDFKSQWGDGDFWAIPTGNANIAVLYESPKARGAIDVIAERCSRDPDAKIVIKNANLKVIDGVKYVPELDIDKYSIARTDSGKKLVLLEVRAGDNLCFGVSGMMEYMPMKKKGNEEAYEKSRKRVSEIFCFWEALEETVIKYAWANKIMRQKTGKEEFSPFN